MRLRSNEYYIINFPAAFVDRTERQARAIGEMRGESGNASQVP